MVLEAVIKHILITLTATKLKLQNCFKPLWGAQKQLGRGEPPPFFLQVDIILKTPSC